MAQHLDDRLAGDAGVEHLGGGPVPELVRSYLDPGPLRDELEGPRKGPTIAGPQWVTLVVDEILLRVMRALLDEQLTQSATDRQARVLTGDPARCFAVVTVSRSSTRLTCFHWIVSSSALRMPVSARTSIASCISSLATFSIFSTSGLSAGSGLLSWRIAGGLCHLRTESARLRRFGRSRPA